MKTPRWMRSTRYVLLQTLYRGLQLIVKIYATLQDRFSTRATYSLGYRLYNLKQLAYLIEDNRAAIHQAVKSDLGGGDFVVDLSDVSIFF